MENVDITKITRLGFKKAIGMVAKSFALCLSNCRVFLLFCATYAVCSTFLTQLFVFLASNFCEPSCHFIFDPRNMIDFVDAFAGSSQLSELPPPPTSEEEGFTLLISISYFLLSFFVAVNFYIAWYRFLGQKLSHLPAAFSFTWTLRHTGLSGVWLLLIGVFVFVSFVIFLPIMVFAFFTFYLLGNLGIGIGLACIICLLNLYFFGIFIRLYLIFPILAIDGKEPFREELIGTFREVLKRTKRHVLTFSLLMPLLLILYLLVGAILGSVILLLVAHSYGSVGVIWWAAQAFSNFFSFMPTVLFVTLQTLLAQHFFPQSFTPQQEA